MNRLTPLRRFLATPASFAAVLTVTLIVAANLLFTPLYTSNDDFNIRLFLSGGFYQTKPTAFVLYIHAYYGLLLSWLYAHAPGAYWYDYLLLLHAMLGTFFLLHALLLLRNDATFRIRLGIVALIVLIIPFIEMGYALAAGYTAGCGIVAGLCALYTDNRSLKRLLGLYCYIAVITGSLLSFDAALCALGFGTVAALPLCIKSSRPQLLSLGRRFGITFLAVIAMHYVDLSFYHDNNDWKDAPDTLNLIEQFQQYNPMLHVMAPEQLARDYKQAMDMTGNDYAMFHDGFCSPLLCNPPRLKQASDGLKIMMREMRNFWWHEFPLQDTLGHYFVLASPYLAVLALLMLAAAQIPTAAYGFYLSAGLVIMLSMLEFYTQPVHFSLYYGLIAMATALLMISIPCSRPPRFFSVSANMILALLGLQIVTQYHTANQTDLIIHDSIVNNVKTLTASAGPDATYMIWASDFPWQDWGLPFQPAPLNDRFHIAFSISPMSAMPVTRDQLARYGVKSIEEAACHPGMYMISSEAHIALFKKSVQEHFQPNRVFVTTLSTLSLKVYHCLP